VVDGPENAAISAVNFDNAGRALAVTDGQNNTRTSTYADIQESTNYAKNALATSRKSALGVAGGYQTTVGLNLTYGLVESVTNPELQVSATSWALNAANNLFTPTTVTSPLNNTSGMGFTATGRPNRVTAANQFAASGAAGPSTTLTWTAGQLTGITNPVSSAITLTRDTNGNLLTTNDPRNARMGYDTCL
jgi:YD repeat-containing protein